MGVAQPVHASPGERLTGTGREALRVERGRDLGMGALLLEELGDPVQGLRRCGAYLPDLPRQGLAQRGRRAAAKADVDRDLTVLAQRDVLEQEGGHALALAGWGARIMPQGGEVGGQRPHLFLQSGIERRAVGRSPALTEILRVAEPAELPVPIRFERVGDQAVGRIDVQVPLAGGVGLVLSALEIKLAQAIGLVQSGLDLVLNGQGDVNGHRIDRRDQELTDRVVDGRTGNDLAHLMPLVIGLQTQVVRHERGAAAMVADAHP